MTFWTKEVTEELIKRSKVFFDELDYRRDVGRELLAWFILFLNYDGEIEFKTLRAVSEVGVEK